MKKILTLLLAVVFVISGCTKSPSETNVTTETNTESTTVEQTTEPQIVEGMTNEDGTALGIPVGGTSEISKEKIMLTHIDYNSIERVGDKLQFTARFETKLPEDTKGTFIPMHLPKDVNLKSVEVTFERILLYEEVGSYAYTFEITDENYLKVNPEERFPFYGIVLAGSYPDSKSYTYLVGEYDPSTDDKHPIGIISTTGEGADVVMFETFDKNVYEWEFMSFDSETNTWKEFYTRTFIISE